MKTKKLFLIIALVVGCAVGAHAQKTVFKFRDAQARAGDAVTEVCVKPTVVEVKILEDKGRIKDEWTLSKEEVEIAMKGELDNIRAWGTYLSTINTTAMSSWEPLSKWKIMKKQGDTRLQ